MRISWGTRLSMVVSGWWLLAAQGDPLEAFSGPVRFGLGIKEQFGTKADLWRSLVEDGGNDTMLS